MARTFRSVMASPSRTTSGRPSRKIRYARPGGASSSSTRSNGSPSCFLQTRDPLTDLEGRETNALRQPDRYVAIRVLAGISACNRSERERVRDARLAGKDVTECLDHAKRVSASRSDAAAASRARKPEPAPSAPRRRVASANRAAVRCARTHAEAAMPVTTPDGRGAARARARARPALLTPEERAIYALLDRGLARGLRAGRGRRRRAARAADRRRAPLLGAAGGGESARRLVRAHRDPAREVGSALRACASR